MNIDASTPTSQRLGDCRIASTIKGASLRGGRRPGRAPARAGVAAPVVRGDRDGAGLREGRAARAVFFDPSKLKCGIVTCGGLCPGLNDVIRAIVLSLYHHYGVATVLGFRYGYEGLVAPATATSRIELDAGRGRAASTSTAARSSARRAGRRTSARWSTRSSAHEASTSCSPSAATARCAGRRRSPRRSQRRGLKIARRRHPQDDRQRHLLRPADLRLRDRGRPRPGAPSYAAHTEAKGARNGIGLVKLMGRDSGFIAAYADAGRQRRQLLPGARGALHAGGASSPRLRERLERRGHAVIVVAEGAGPGPAGDDRRARRLGQRRSSATSASSCATGSRRHFTAIGHRS